MTSAAVAGPNAAQVAPHDRLRVGRRPAAGPASGRPGRRPRRRTAASSPAAAAARAGTSTRARWASAFGGTSGRCSAIASPSAFTGSGPSASAASAAARTSPALEVDPGRVFWLTLRSRSWAGWVQPRSVSASSGTSRWMVPRIVSSRTSDRSSSPRVTSYGSKASSRAASERYGGRFSWACSPTRWRDHPGDRHRRPLEQVLAGEQGAVEVTPGQLHATSVPARTDGSARKNARFGAQEPHGSARKTHGSAGRTTRRQGRVKSLVSVKGPLPSAPPDGSSVEATRV